MKKIAVLNLYNGIGLKEILAMTCAIIIGFAVLIDGESLPMNFAIGLAAFLPVVSFGTTVMLVAILVLLPVRHPETLGNFKKQIAAGTVVHRGFPGDRTSYTKIFRALWPMIRTCQQACLLRFEFALVRDSYVAVSAGNSLSDVNSGAAVSLIEGSYFQASGGRQFGMVTARSFDVRGRTGCHEGFGDPISLHPELTPGDASCGAFQPFNDAFLEKAFLNTQPDKMTRKQKSDTMTLTYPTFEL